MKTSLHITNGDLTTSRLQELEIKGEIITWREMLCEGKTLTQVGSETFWKIRYDFLKSSYKVSKRTFINHTLKEYRNLCQQKQQDEIILWFDHELFSQINMLAVISWLKRYRANRKITLIQSGTSINVKKQKNLSALTSTQLTNLYNKRIELSKDDIEFADYMWQLYSSECPLRLETTYKLNKNTVFTHLEKAIKSHLLRFPSIKNGLNSLENNILASSKQNKLKSKEELVQSLLNNQKAYGFEYIQYDAKLANLKKLFSSFNPVKLTKTGNKVLNNQVNYYGKIRDEFAYLGGTKKYNYLYINEHDKLLKISS